jgi:predicted N-acetyltransferase YhbS
MTDFTLAPPEPLAVDAGLAFALERPQDDLLVDEMIDRAFGPGRFAKTAERLREGARLRRDLSICAWDGRALVGAARQWSVRIGETPAVFLGPFAVEAAWRSRGLGAALIVRACALAEAGGERLTLLVGDMGYFGPLGFERVPAGQVALPGPVDPRRVLWRGHAPGALDGLAGRVRPASDG